MANALFYAFRNGILGGHATYVDMNANNIGAMFVDHGTFTPDVTNLAHDFVSDITAGAQVPAFASCPNLANPTIGTISVGVYDADNTVFTSLTGSQAESLVLFKDTDTDTSSNLIAFWDTATGLPLTPNGGNVTVAWNASGIIAV